MASKFKVLEKNKKEFIENFWLNLGDTSTIKTYNTIGANQIFKENPVLGIVDIMRKPENFGFTCQALFGLKLHPFQILALQMIWKHPFLIFIATRGGGKSFLLAVYALLRAIFTPGSKIIFTGSSFRQSKIIFNNCEAIWKNSPILQDILSYDKNNKPLHSVDMYQFQLGQSILISLPTGNGEKIRGQRATCLIVDEFNSIDVNIYEEVMQGFGAVSMNPVSAVIEQAKLEALLQLGDIEQETFDDIQSKIMSNQQIISGTCGYTFEHLYRYWKRYHDIIMSKGDKEKLKQIFSTDIPPGFNYKDYCIVRLPYDILPRGYMDEKTIGKAKVTSNSGIFASEYCGVFISDSLGFFRRTLIERCTARNTTPAISKPSCGIVDFSATLKGVRGGKYIMAIDPAAEADNFAIVILELHPDHRRIVYCWTVNEKKHKQKVRMGDAQEHDYYRFCGRKIRDLMKVFKIEAIALDTQGGGRPIREVLGDPQYLLPGEHAIYEVSEFDVHKDTDNLEGLHILHMINFVEAKWVYDANHGLRQDMETQELIFPVKDSLAFGLAREEDKIYNRMKINEDLPELENYYDTLENCMLEIEEMKNELVIIDHTKTPSGRDKWDTPSVKGVGTKKGRLMKDRYSALLMANMVGRSLINRMAPEEYAIGGLAHEMIREEKNRSAGWEYGFGVQGNRRRF